MERVQEILNEEVPQQRKDNYEKMYQELFKEITNALEILKNKDISGIQEVQQILTDAQCHTEEMYMNAEENYNHGDYYADILKRLDLQSLGYFIKEGSTVTKKRCTKFVDREKDAEKKLFQELEKWKQERCNADIYPAIVQFAAIREEVQFSLGMKVGARLALLLTGDFQNDI